jgi:electron transport complex protein RnfD
MMMLSQKKLIVSHAPFWHDGSSITERNFNILVAAMPAVLHGLMRYGMPALGVVCLAVSTAMLWEIAFNRISKQSLTVFDGNAALLGLILAMLLPATTPWWLVVVGTLLAIIVGKQIFGGLGGNAFHPVALAFAMLIVSWGDYFDFNLMLANYDLPFLAVYPLTWVKQFGVESVASFSVLDLLMGKQIGGIGATFGLGLIAGGVYLMARGICRWEIALSFLAGVAVTALLFHISDPARYASAPFHLLTGYTLIGAFFLATEDSSSPVNFVPMLIYGATGGVMTVLIRNLGVYVDGVIFAILLINLMNPLVDKIRPKAIGKVA